MLDLFFPQIGFLLSSSFRWTLCVKYGFLKGWFMGVYNDGICYLHQRAGSRLDGAGAGGIMKSSFELLEICVL